MWTRLGVVFCSWLALVGCEAPVEEDLGPMYEMSGAISNSWTGEPVPNIAVCAFVNEYSATAQFPYSCSSSPSSDTSDYNGSFYLTGLYGGSYTVAFLDLEGNHVNYNIVREVHDDSDDIYVELFPYRDWFESREVFGHARFEYSGAENGEFDGFITFDDYPINDQLMELDEYKPPTYGSGEESLDHADATLDGTKYKGSRCDDIGVDEGYYTYTNLGDATETGDTISEGFAFEFYIITGKIRGSLCDEEDDVGYEVEIDGDYFLAFD